MAQFWVEKDSLVTIFYEKLPSKKLSSSLMECKMSKSALQQQDLFQRISHHEKSNKRETNQEIPEDQIPFLDFSFFPVSVEGYASDLAKLDDEFCDLEKSDEQNLHKSISKNLIEKDGFLPVAGKTPFTSANNESNTHTGMGGLTPNSVDRAESFSSFHNIIGYEPMIAQQEQQLKNLGSVQSLINTTYETHDFTLSKPQAACTPTTTVDSIISGDHIVNSISVESLSSFNSVVSSSKQQQQQSARNDHHQHQHRFKPSDEKKWNRRFKEFLEFVRENGHGIVPHSYQTNPHLASWVKRQRRQYKLLQTNEPSTLTVERLNLLTSAGFVWDSHEVSWREKLNALKRYRYANGHCNVPAKYGDHKLGTWVRSQRRQYKLYSDGKPSAINLERIQQLEILGFEWEIRAVAAKRVSI